MLEDCLQKFGCIHLDYLILVEIMLHQNQLLFVIFLNLHIAVGIFWLTTSVYYSKSIILSLKVVSAIFLQVGFICLRESTCETRKSVFLFHFERSFCSWDDQI